MPVPVALGALYVGIVLGDIGLYGLGRLSARISWLARRLPPHRQAAVRAWISGRVFKVVLVSRFLPGLRLPTYTTCGFVGADLRQFILAADGRDHVLDQPAVRRFAAGRPIPDGPSGGVALGGRRGFVIFIILAGRAAAVGMQDARR